MASNWLLLEMVPSVKLGNCCVFDMLFVLLEFDRFFFFFFQFVD